MGSLELNGMGSLQEVGKKIGEWWGGGGGQISSVVWSRKKISKFTLTRSTSVKLKYFTNYEVEEVGIIENKLYQGLKR